MIRASQCSETTASPTANAVSVVGDADADVDADAAAAAGDADTNADDEADAAAAGADADAEAADDADDADADADAQVRAACAREVPPAMLRLVSSSEYRATTPSSMFPSCAKKRPSRIGSRSYSKCFIWLKEISHVIAVQCNAMQCNTV